MPSSKELQDIADEIHGIRNAVYSFAEGLSLTRAQHRAVDAIVKRLDAVNEKFPYTSSE